MTTFDSPPKLQSAIVRPRASFARAISRGLGSLQVAIASLTLFAAVLVLGTVIESWYESQIAQQLVYGTWWFKAILVTLGINILFAALKKRPWKRHQFGFLVTHIGLLMLVSGGLVTSWIGTHGTMILTEAPNGTSQNSAASTSHQILDPRSASIRILRAANPDEPATAEFLSLPTAWRTGEFPQFNPRSLTSWLTLFSHPWPSGWQFSFAKNESLQVIEFVPHAKPQPFSPEDGTGNRATFPAVQLEFTSPLTGRLPPRWLAQETSANTLRLGPAVIEFVGQVWPEIQLREWQQPTEIKRDADLRAVLQFVTGRDQKLFYRSFHGPDGANLRWEAVGEVSIDSQGQSQRIWSKMNWRFRVLDFLPQAVHEPTVQPLVRPIGLVDPATPSAIHCEIQNGTQAKKFWLTRTAGEVTPVFVGDQKYLVGYNAKLHELDFALTLNGTEQTLEPGSELPAKQTCYVSVHDPSRLPVRSEHLISLNEPLVHRGYKIYLSSLQVVGRTASGQPITRGTLTVARDPGVRLKYAGASMVACGIACMFIMRAYPLRRRTDEPVPRKNS